MKVYLLMFMATFFWAGAFIAGKLGINDLNPALLTFLRMGIATVILFPILVFREPSSWRLKKSEIPIILATGLIGMVGYHMFFFSALQFTTASKASMINASNPLITAVLASLFVGEHLNMKKVGYILVAFSSVVFILIDGNLQNLFTLSLNQGDLLMLCGTFSWAIYSIIVKKNIHKFGALKLSAYTFLSCTMMMLPFAMYFFMTTDALTVGYKPYLAVLYMAIFPTVIGYLIQQYAIGKIGPSKSALFINLVPIISTILAVIFLGEHIQYFHLISVGLIIFSVIGFNQS